MPYPVEEKFVIAVASSALFDLAESDRVFREEGLARYREYQRAHENDLLAPGIAFPLINRLLALNGPEKTYHPVEVILVSHNDPDTGLRVFKSIEKHELDITRAAFVSGGNAYMYLEAFNACLFLSANPKDVRNAMSTGTAAGLVFPTQFIDDPEAELRIAFDFDGVIADDSAEAVYKAEGLEKYFRSEREKASEPLPVGPLHRFFTEVAKLQRAEIERSNADPKHKPRIRIAIITARNAPAHERVAISLRRWGIQVDEVFYLGGIDKSRVLRVFKPHMFFDDQVVHIEGAASIAPCAHVPFGVANRTSAEETNKAAAVVDLNAETTVTSAAQGVAPPQRGSAPPGAA